MPLRSAEPGDEFYQEITEDNYEIELERTPDRVRRLYTSNMIDRVISHNYVFDGTIWRPMSGTSSGKVDTNQVSSGYTEYIYDSYSATSGSPDIIDLGDIYDLVIVASRNTYDIGVAFSTDGVTYGDVINHDEYQTAEYPISARYVRISTASGVAATGHILAYK